MATRTTARRARARKPRGPKSRDRHWLYQESVQSPEVHFGFFERAYRERTGRRPLSLKEDFCGTALLAARWVEGRRDRTAIGVDLDAPTLRWAHKHNIAPLSEHARARITLRRGNVMHVVKPKVDIVVALNFSYNIFHSRAALRAYFEAARRSLTPGGVFIVDMFGGWDSQRPMTERTRHRGFTYLWELHHYDPVANFGQFYIHFKFRDGGGIRRAFSYAWRTWSIPEVREILLEAGFKDLDLYWEGFDTRTGLGNSVFRKVTRAKNSPGWIAFFVASA
ncbi:MAG: class I SAM-dependent methyltransferase [Candidatus Latescibacteria bacterium]|nr:class I SAM-dependent methyltransferase [Candidatus Latescibacterota bacterium]